MRRSTAMLLIAGLLTMPVVSRAGALDRFEEAHRPPSDDSKKSSSSDSSSSSSSSDDSDHDEDPSYYDNTWDDEEEGSSEGGDAVWAFVLFCGIPPFVFACFHPAHRPAREVYGTDELYVEPEGDRSEDGILSERMYRKEDRERMRWGEISLLGYRAFNEPVVYSHDLDITAWLGPVLAHVTWEHFYEEIQETGELDHLDILGGHLGANVLGPWVDSTELYLTAGAIVLHGEHWTPAFDAGLDLRVYPVNPLALHASANLSVFGIGPVLLDARLDAGVALGPLEIRLGPRWLYQGEAQGFWGPAATLAGRF